MATVIKKVRCVNDTDRQDLLTSGRTYNVTKVIGNYAYVLDGVKYMHSMDRFEDVIEPDFKVGDKVVFAREDYGSFSEWNKDHTIGKTYTVIKLSETERNIYTNTRLFMPMKCFELAPEPKPEPKFKVGDWVRVTKEVLPSDSKYIGNIYAIVGLGLKEDWYILENCPLAMRKDQLELADVTRPFLNLGKYPKPEVKERATVKKVRCIDATCSRYQLIPNKIYEVEEEGTTSWGTNYYIIKGGDGTRFMRSRFVDVVEEKYPQIVKFNTFKVIFNPPYTIVEMPIMFSDRKYTGKAKCNPEDTYDKWTGYKLAYERMMESKPCSK